MAPRSGAPADRALGQPTDAELEAIRARVATLDVRGWFDELTRLLHLSDEIGLGWLAAEAPWRTMELAGWPLDEPVRFIGPDARDLPLPAHLLPSLLVSLSAPDSVILAEVGHALKKARQHYPQPFDRPGMAKQFATVDWRRLFGSWCDHRIVELAELLAWRHRLPEGEKPDMVKLAKRVGLDTDRNRIDRAEAKIGAAIASLPQVVAQLRHDGYGGDLAPERTVALPGIDANGRLMLAAQAMQWSTSADQHYRAEGARLAAWLRAAPRAG